MKFQIKNRFTGLVAYACEFSAEFAGRSYGFRLGFAIKDAVLSDADLSGAVLRDIRNDFWDVLLRAQHEISGLLEAVREGHVSGSTYKGECACLVGTIANVRHVDFASLGNGLDPNCRRPIERFFLAIKNAATKAAIEPIA